MPENERINKFIAGAGICSRRDADRLIEQKKVSVNGKCASFGMTVSDTDIVCVNGKEIKRKDDKVVLAFYKPVGVTCTERDKYAKKTIAEYVKYPTRLTYAGRLDKDSEGLLLLTNDGDLIQALMKGRGCHEKEYVVRVNKEITKEFLEKMSKGVYLKELDRTTKPCIVEQVGKMTFRIILTQGLNRQIRRMAESFGYQVMSLKRIRIENITLDGIKYGEFRKLTVEETKKLYETVGL